MKPTTILASAAVLSLALAACADDPTAPGAAPAAADPHAPSLSHITLVPVYTVTVIDLGTLGAATDGTNRSRAYGINDSGFVTGGTTRTGFSTTHDNVFRWHSATGMVYAGLRGTGRDINLGGTITGETYILTGGPNGQAFTLSPAGVATGLGYMPNCFESWAKGINDAGQAVGQSRECYEHITGWFRAGTRWEPSLAKTAYVLGGWAPDRISSLYDINNATQVVGTASDSSGMDVGFRHTPGVGYELIKPWSATVNVVPQAINGAGMVAGYETTTGVGTFPFRWSPGSGFTYLGGGGTQGKAFAVGHSDHAAGWAASAPVLWRPDGTTVFLPRLAGAVATPCSESECAAQDMNANLEVVGYDKTAGGEVHAVLWRVRIMYRISIKLFPFEPIRPIYWGAGELIPVALLSTPGFDAREIHPSILRLGNDDGNDTPVAIGRYGLYMSSHKDVDGDGDLDLVAYFNQSALEQNKDIAPGTVALYLTGELGGGERIRGAQKVEVVAKY